MDYVSLLEYKIKSELCDCIGYLEDSHNLSLVEKVEQRLSTVRNIINAIQFAKKIHKDQVDLGKQPYINHPLRVAGRVLVANGGVNGDLQEVEHAIITALLHDTIEDAEKEVDVITVIKSIGGWPCLRAVKCLTKEEDETYETYIERVSRNRLATVVKMADLQDNLDPSRKLKETPGSLKRREKYEKALNFLKSKIKA